MTNTERHQEVHEIRKVENPCTHGTSVIQTKSKVRNKKMDKLQISCQEVEDGAKLQPTKD